MSNTQHTPPIGSEWTEHGGIYVGLSIHDNKPVHLILLPGEVTGGWSKATAWAKEQSAELPSRVDALILFQNMRKKFELDWYWTNAQYAGYVACAWCQDFSDGSQYYGSKNDELRARAVKRVAL